MKRYLICLLVVLSTGTASLTTTHAQQPETKKSEPVRSERLIPYRGTVGAVDLKKKTFTLKNKAGDKTRLFKIDAKTVFEADKAKKMLKDIQPGLSVRGSCLKVKDREYVARLVRWTIQTSPKGTAESP